METELIIKNMVCPRCIEAVENAMQAVEVPFSRIELGKVTLKSPLTPTQKALLTTTLESKGFELLESRNAALISQIKALIVQQIHHSTQNLTVNYSTFLTEKLNQEYSSLSKVFSQVEGITIEKFITRQKLEKVKEFLTYDQLTLSEIADKLGYSSVAYLSSQFKRESGMTPSKFRQNKLAKRNSLDWI
ncbi:hypothetical protein GCM10009119_10470 [Algoriphagus jejuensis]|uniref:HTH araC/xylS-type domain-containing protein n=1 Tax=Algoriphagus jejuensis TaxID=419934 RepID=A0ABN1MYA0_9BACT